MIWGYGIGLALLVAGWWVVNRATNPPAADIGLALMGIGGATMFTTAIVQCLP